MGKQEKGDEGEKRGEEKDEKLRKKMRMKRTRKGRREEKKQGKEIDVVTYVCRLHDHPVEHMTVSRYLW